MKKIINGRMYNTDTAKRLCSADNGGSCRDFSHWEEELYQKKTGEFFLYGEGGPASKYSRSCGQNEWCGGCDITPMTEQQAREWMERNATADEYIEVFGEPEEQHPARILCQGCTAQSSPGPPPRQQPGESRTSTTAQEVLQCAN